MTKTFSAEEYRRALQAWAWLDLAGKEPMFTSLFGDVFFGASDGWWHLDTIVGELTRCGHDAAEVMAVLDTAERQDRYLYGVFAQGAAGRGVALKDNEVYAFAPPPAMGGPFDVSNIVTLPFVVAHVVAGQMHEQLNQRRSADRPGKRWFRR